VDLPGEVLLESELSPEFAAFAVPLAEADADVVDLVVGAVSAFGEALWDRFEDFAGLGVPPALAHPVSPLLGTAVAAVAAVAVALAPTLADPDAATDCDVSMLGLTGGLLAGPAADAGLDGLAGVDVTTGLLVCGEVLADATAEADVVAHGAPAEGRWLGPAVGPLLLAAPSAACPAEPCPSVVPAPPPLDVCPVRTDEPSWTMA